MQFESEPNPLAKAEQDFFSHYRYLIAMSVLESKYGKESVQNADLSLTPQLESEIREVLTIKQADEINLHKKNMLECATLQDLETYCGQNDFVWPEKNALEELKKTAMENMEKESEDDAEEE